MSRVLSSLYLQWRRAVLCAGTTIALGASPASAFAGWTPAQLDLLDRAFVSAVANDYGVQTHGWQVVACDGVECMGNNPDTVYQLPAFDANGRLDRPLGPTGALVLLMETPPPMRYFGVTSYLYSKYYVRRSGRVTVAQSMNDTSNHLVTGTTGGAVAGDNPFGQLAAFIVAADDTTARDVSTRLQALGFPASAINRLDLPVSYDPPVPLNLGLGAFSDTFTVMLRMTYPQDASAFAAYLARSPARVHYLEPRVARALDPVPATVFRTPGSGLEASALRSGRDALIVDWLAAHGTGYSSVAETEVHTLAYRPFLCMQRFIVQCYLDNPDAVYTGSSGSLTLAQDDKILVVGVDHGLTANGTGKASIFSHALNAPQAHRGVLAVADDWLHGSGLKALGLSDPLDPRYATYSRMYAFTLAYRCDPGDPVCITIPQTGANGAPLGTPLRIGSRLYLDPATKTRPNANDLVLERIFLLRK